MADPTHVVLGGNGALGRETLRALVARGLAPISVGRRPAAVAGVQSARADLLDADAAARALDGAEVAYFVPGIAYSARVWEQQWPVLVQNTLDAALANGTRLIYLDNIYAYGAAPEMTEATPIAPVSRKGRVRAGALTQIEAARHRGLEVTVARSADFYGPGATTSVFTTFALDRIAAGRPPVWLLDADQPHSLTYTPDIGDALALLGTADSVEALWHLPTAPALTGREYLRIAAGESARISVMSAATLRLGALFTSAARETWEMRYQYTAPSVLDSTDFIAAFGMQPTPIAEGIAATLTVARKARAATR